MKCLVPGCTNEALCRGQCQSDYKASVKLVKAKKTTWEKLEKRGFAKPPLKGRVKVALGLVKSKR